MKKTTFIVLIMAMALGSACDKKNNSNSSPELPPLEDIPEGEINDKLDQLVLASVKDKKTTAQDRDRIAFQKIRELCEASGAKFHERQRRCVCPATDAGPQLWRISVESRENKKNISAKCEAPLLLKTDPKVAPTFEKALSLGADTFYSQLQSAAGAGIEENVDATFSIAEGLPDDVRMEFFSVLAKKLDSKPLYFDPIPAYFGRSNREKLLLVYDESQLDHAIKTYMGAWVYHRRSELGSQNLRFSTFLSDLDQLGPALSRFNPSERQKWQLPDLMHGSPDHEEGLRLYLAAEVFREYLDGKREAPEGFSRDVLITENGCHIRCSVRERFQVEGDWFSYEKFYVFGRIAHERLNRYSGPGVWHGAGFESSVVFNRGGDVSMLIFAEPNFKTFATSWQYRFYDDRGKFFTGKNVAVANPGEAEQFSQALNMENPDLERSAPVILVDGRLDFRFSEIAKWIKKGPHFSNGSDRDHDLLGWLEIPKSYTPGKRLLDFYDGFVDSMLDLRFWYGKQGSITANTLIKGSNRQWPISVIPSPAINLSSDMGKIKRLIAASKARVVNLSQVFQIEGKESCSANNFHGDDSVIWVVTAGNAGNVNPIDTCHPLMEPRYRTITVAASVADGSRLEHYSDRGRNYADIAAPGQDKFHGTTYTSSSISTARVSRVLGKIVYKYGKVLNNQLIRLAVLLSAKVDVRNRMDTRTGGSLNEEGAMTVAGYMSDILLGNIPFPDEVSKEELMHAMIKKSGALKDDKEIKSQVNYLLESGIYGGAP